MEHIRHGRRLPILPAPVVGAGEAHRTDDRQQGFGTDFPVSGVMPTGARYLTLLSSRSFELQQLA